MTPCTMQAIIFFYGGLINGVAWMMLSIELYQKIVIGTALYSTVQNTYLK